MLKNSKVVDNTVFSDILFQKKETEEITVESLKKILGKSNCSDFYPFFLIELLSCCTMLPIICINIILLKTFYEHYLRN